ncbi:MAG: hypothetical protein J6A01_07615 [Proteobacteria bacterium]|nr:hypothetical protein [Pseudomonadota bacterium]
MRKLIILLSILTLCFTMGCSKKNKKEAAEPPASSKTVDLGETAPDESEEKAEAPKDKKNSKKDKDEAKRDGKKRPSKEAADNDDKKAQEREWARKNEEASKNPDGTPKRGKPAAEEQFEEAQKAKAEKEDKKKPKAEEEPAPEAQDNTLDFTDDDVETANADDQPAPPPPPPREAKPKPALNIEKYINIRELREQTSYSGALAEDWLLGQNTDARYSSARLATDKPDQLGFTVQVWKPGNEANASKRFNDLFKQSFGGQKISGVASDAFIASHHNIHELGFYEKSKRSAVLLSCSEEVCSKDQLKSIALVILRRL